MRAAGQARRVAADGADADASTGVRENGFYSAVTWGTGFGYFGGAGVIADAGGNDVYTQVSTAAAEAVAIDAGVTAPGTPSAAADSFWAIAWGQGMGLIGGAGMVADSGGDDRYTATAASDATAEATSAGVPAGAARANAGSVTINAQGHGSQGVGVLRDDAGTDSYSAEATADAAASPATLVVKEGLVTAAQGSVDTGAGWLADVGGTADVFASVPVRPACSGTRGGESWSDCGAGVGGGTNR
jgi:hypothetical protein